MAVVGEAPGFKEASLGRPFIGPSGQLLDKVLGHYGYKREEVLYTNAVLCRPDGNATPSKVAIQACRGRLMAELSGSGVGAVVALGGTAASVLVDDPRSITSLRVGPAKQPTALLRDSNISRVVPTWHPAYCLRTADAFPSLVADIGKLKEKRRSAWRPPDWKYFEDPADARAVLEELQSFASHLAVDIEVGIEKDTDFGHPNEYELLCVGLGYARGKVVVIGGAAISDGSVLVRLKQLLQSVKIIAHNGKFDLGGLYPHFGGLELWFDTMLASYVCDERPGGHSLETRSIEDLGAPSWKHEIKRFIPKGGSYANVPRPILYKYNAYDVACTYELYEMFCARFESSPGMRELHDFLVAASNQLMYLELNGIAIDKAYLNELRGKFILRLEGIEQQLEEIVGRVLNPRSPKQIKEFLAEKGINVDSTNQDTLERLMEILQVQRGVPVDHPVIRFITTLLVHRRQQKLFSTYVEGIRKRIYRGRVYTTYLLHGSTSGRLASRNPNLQNIVRDKDIRRQFTVAKEGNVFVQCDYKQAEARVVATLAQDEYLREILSRDEPGYDFFDELSDQLYGKGNWRKDVERIRTKAFFYGLSYGREAYSIALEYGMSVPEAERRLQEFMSLIPATAVWQKAVRDEVLAGNDLVTTFGRRRRFWLITDQNQKDVLNEALSFLPQSTASDICLSALIRVRPMLRGLGFLRLTIHDALTAECPEERKDDVAQILMETMADEGRKWTDYVPFPVDIKVGTSWGDFL